MPREAKEGTVVRLRLLVPSLALMGLLAACGPAAHTDAACRAEFAKRADFVKQADNADKIDWFPELIRACGAVNQWTSAAKAYPDALLRSSDPIRELEVGCTSRDPDLSDEPLCREIAGEQARPDS